MKRHQRAALAAAALALVIPVSGCASLLSPHQTAEYHYNGGDGAWGSIGDIEVRGLLLIRDSAENGPAQLFFTLINSGDSKATVTLEVAGEKFTQSIDPGETFVQDPESPATSTENTIIVDDLTAGAGDLADVTVTVGDDEKTIQTQVLSDVLPYYEEYVPTEEPSETPGEGANPTEGAGSTEEANAAVNG